MIIAAHTHREFVEAQRAMERALARLRVILEEPARSERRVARESVALTSAIERYDRAMDRDQFWYAAHKRARWRNLAEAGSQRHRRLSIVMPYGATLVTDIECECGWSCRHDDLETALHAHGRHAEREARVARKN